MIINKKKNGGGGGGGCKKENMVETLKTSCTNVMVLPNSSFKEIRKEQNCRKRRNSQKTLMDNLKKTTSKPKMSEPAKNIQGNWKKTKKGELRKLKRQIGSLCVCVCAWSR